MSKDRYVLGLLKDTLKKRSTFVYCGLNRLLGISYDFFDIYSKKVKKNFMQVSKNFSVRVNGTSVSFNGFLGRYFKYIDIGIRFRLIKKRSLFCM